MICSSDTPENVPNLERSTFLDKDSSYNFCGFLLANSPSSLELDKITTRYRPYSGWTAAVGRVVALALQPDIDQTRSSEVIDWNPSIDERQIARLYCFLSSDGRDN